MARNFDPDRRPGFFSALRSRLYRSNDGKLLGVFKGIAESIGWKCFWTRTLGVLALLILADTVGAHGLMVTALVSGFFYLLLALLMQPPRAAGTLADPISRVGRSLPPLLPSERYPGYSRRRVDLAQLDRQLDGLNHRIQRMEAIVTDREYDWNRRMAS